MADYTIVDTNNLLPGEPWTTALANAAFENPVAITEGAVDAPRIDPINAMAHQGALNAVGTYIFANSSLSSNVAPGATTSGSNLQAASMFVTSSANNAEVSGGTLPGTWRCMGYSRGSNSPSVLRGITLWLRIA